MTRQEKTGGRLTFTPVFLVGAEKLSGVTVTRTAHIQASESSSEKHHAYRFGNCRSRRVGEGDSVIPVVTVWIETEGDLSICEKKLKCCHFSRTNIVE